jgi:hypothetical protein
VKYYSHLSSIIVLIFLPSLLIAQDLVQLEQVESCQKLFDDFPPNQDTPPGYVAIDGNERVQDHLGSVLSSSTVRVEVFQFETAVLKVIRKRGRSEVVRLKFELMDPGNPVPENRVMISLAGVEIRGQIQSLKMISDEGIESPFWGIKLLLDVLHEKGIDLSEIKFDFAHRNFFLSKFSFTAESIRKAILGPESDSVSVARELFKVSLARQKRIALASVLYTRGTSVFDRDQTVREVLLEGFSDYVHHDWNFSPETEEEFNILNLREVLRKAILDDDISWIISSLPELNGDVFFLLNKLIHNRYFNHGNSLGFESTPDQLKESFSRILSELKEKISQELVSFKEIPEYEINPYYFRTILALPRWFFTSRHQTSLVELLDSFEGVRETFLEYTQLLADQINRSRTRVNITNWWVDILMMRAYLGESSNELEVSLTAALRDPEGRLRRDRIRKILENNF